MAILRLIATNELIINRHKIMKYIDNENCFFFRSAVIDIFEGWRTWIQSESEEPLDIWKNTLNEITTRYLFPYSAKMKAQEMDSKIEEIFKNDRIGIIDTDTSLDDE